jgi:hypothetical protein
MNTDGQGWDLPTVNQMFIPMEAQKIPQLPINYEQEDSIIWDGTTDGNYTVKAGYHAIKDWEDSANRDTASTSNPPITIWDKLWKLNTPPKISHQIWRIMQNAIPTRANLLKKGILCDPICPICLSKVESANHLFLDCIWARQVWLSSPLTLNLSNNTTSDVTDWLMYMFHHTDSDCMEKVITIIYSIYGLREINTFSETLPLTQLKSATKPCSSLMNTIELVLSNRPSSIIILLHLTLATTTLVGTLLQGEP